MLYVLAVSWIVGLLTLHLFLKAEFDRRPVSKFPIGRQFFRLTALMGVILSSLMVGGLRLFLGDSLSSIVRAHAQLTILWFVFQFVTYYFLAKADYRRMMRRFMAAISVLDPSRSAAPKE
jgi:hypothetical protein